MKDRLCQHGNCEETKVAITINYRNEERPCFCCAEHAILWLLRRDRSHMSLAAFDRIQEQMVGLD